MKRVIEKIMVIAAMVMLCSFTVCGVDEDAEMQLELGFRYFRGDGVEKDLKKGVYFVRKAAEQGYPRAEYFMAHLYSEGHGVEKDYKRHIYWMRKAAEHGYVVAQMALSFHYYKAKDHKQQIYWMRKAAEQGNADAQYFLAGMYLSGTHKDLNQAKYWLRKASRQGHEEATRVLRRLGW